LSPLYVAEYGAHAKIWIHGFTRMDSIHHMNKLSRTLYLKPAQRTTIFDDKITIHSTFERLSAAYQPIFGQPLPFLSQLLRIYDYRGTSIWDFSRYVDGL